MFDLLRSPNDDSVLRDWTEAARPERRNAPKCRGRFTPWGGGRRVPFGVLEFASAR